MSSLVDTLKALALAALVAAPTAAADAGQSASETTGQSARETEAPHWGFGSPATPEQIAGWDIDIRPDGAGLPEGSATAADGEEVYDTYCSACHGVFGEGAGRYAALIGGSPKALRLERPEKTIGSYWPHATTVFDYVRRAMPFGSGQTLSDEETYAVTAYLLNLNGIIDSETVIDAQALPEVVMPNHDGFVADARPDTANVRCMRACVEGERVVASRAKSIGVTPEGEEAEDPFAAFVTATDDKKD